MKWPLLIITLVLAGMAQGQSFFNSGKSNLYYFGVNLGVAGNSWSSKTSDYKLFSPYGQQLVDGDSRLKAQTSSELVEIETIFPLGDNRLGVGMSFEFFSLLALDVETKGQFQTFGFPEYFKTDKFYVQFERPLYTNDLGTFEWYASGRLGAYAFSMVRSTSLFGESRWGKSVFGGAKTGFEFSVMEKFYLGLSGLFEYKYFNNSGKEAPEDITHHFISYGIMLNARVSFR